MTSTERELFEVWALEDMMNRNQRDSDGKYQQIKMQWMWQAWQAARRSLVVSHGWKLVPEVPTMEMVSAGDRNAVRVHWRNGRADIVPAIYHAMLAAAPQPPGTNTHTNNSTNS